MKTNMTPKCKSRPGSGQGLVEFALILPVLLLLVAGTAEFGRIFAIYSNLFNAAREGTRYAMVNAADTSGILAAIQSKIELVDPAQVTVTISYDTGPGSGTGVIDPADVTAGDRVIIALHYDIEPMLPLLEPLLSGMTVDTQSVRTVSRGGGAMPGPGGAMPTFTPTLTATPTPTETPDGAPTATPTETPTETPVPTFTPLPTNTPVDPPTETPTETPVPTNTPTLTPTPIPPIDIYAPLLAGDGSVWGSAWPNQTLTLRDIQDLSVRLTTTADDSGTFVFVLSKVLVVDHVIVVDGYGKSDWAPVGPAPTPTPTSTSTPTPAPLEIRLSQTCGSDASTPLTVYGYGWPTTENLYIKHMFGGVEQQVLTLKKSTFSADFQEPFTIDTTQPGVHTIEAISDAGGTYSVSFLVPCPAPTPTPTATSTPTPTPTPLPPNLVVANVALVNDGKVLLKTYDPLTFIVSISNPGPTAVNDVFFTDLYIDSVDGQFSRGTDWIGLNYLAAGASVDLTLSLPAGISSIGEHNAYVLVDSLNQVAEENETDNQGTPYLFNIALAGVPPTPGPAATPTPVGAGAISGTTYFYWNREIIPMGRVTVYCYLGDTIVAETVSDANGDFLLQGLAPGGYMLIGDLTLEGVLYIDLALDIPVSSGSTTPYVTLYLH